LKEVAMEEATVTPLWVSDPKDPRLSAPGGRRCDGCDLGASPEHPIAAPFLVYASGCYCEACVLRFMVPEDGGGWGVRGTGPDGTSGWRITGTPPGMRLIRTTEEGARIYAGLLNANLSARGWTFQPAQLPADVVTGDLAWLADPGG
jgi:hypothetical protein